MKPQFKLEEIYIDLSKLSEEQQRKISVLINGVLNLNSDRFLLSFNPYNQKWELHKYLYNGKELTYSQFLDMMGESEEVLQVENTVFNIDFGGHVMAGLKIINGEIEVVGAINGYGNGISTDEIIITKFNQ